MCVCSSSIACTRLVVEVEREAGLQLGGLLKAGPGGVIETVVGQAAGVHGNGVSCVRVVLMWCCVGDVAQAH